MFVNEVGFWWNGHSAARTKTIHTCLRDNEKKRTKLSGLFGLINISHFVFRQFWFPHPEGGKNVSFWRCYKTYQRRRCNRTRQWPGPDNDHAIWSFSGPEILGPHNDHLGPDNNHTNWSLSGPEILGPHNDVKKIVRSLSGPDTPGKWCIEYERERVSEELSVNWNRNPHPCETRAVH